MAQSGDSFNAQQKFLKDYHLDAIGLHKFLKEAAGMREGNCAGRLSFS